MNRFAFKASLIATVLTISAVQMSDAAPAKKSVKTAKPAVHAAANSGAAQHGDNNGAASAAYNVYLTRLRAKLEKNWYLPDGKNNVQLTLHVDPDGSVTNLNVKSSPQNAQAEQAAQDAFNHSQPLEALPTSTPVQMTLEFASYADPHGDSNRQIKANMVPVTTEQKKAE